MTTGALAHESGLICRDLSVMQDFCTSALGFDVEEQVEVPGVGTLVKLRHGEVRVKLFRPVDDVAPPLPVDATNWRAAGGWRYVSVYVQSSTEVDDIADAVVRAGGTLLIEPVSYRPGSYIALFSDPEHNVWELLHREDFAA